MRQEWEEENERERERGRERTTAKCEGTASLIWRVSRLIDYCLVSFFITIPELRIKATAAFVHLSPRVKRCDSSFWCLMPSVFVLCAPRFSSLSSFHCLGFFLPLFLSSPSSSPSLSPSSPAAHVTLAKGRANFNCL